ncbi:hypothetical protein BGX34_002945, partial [Mortierella sp. NVP85]
MQYVIPDHQSELSSTVASTQSDGTTTSTVRPDLDYKSPLSMLRSYRLSPRYLDSVHDDYRSLTYSHKIDPMKPMCLYELAGGSCNDDASGIHNADLLINSIAKNHRDFVRDSSRIVKFGQRIRTKNEPVEGQVSQENPRASGRSRAVDALLRPRSLAQIRLTTILWCYRSLQKCWKEHRSNKNKRYHEHHTPEYSEGQLDGDMSNEVLWIEYVMSLLSEASLDGEDNPVQKAIAALARGITSGVYIWT